MSIVRVLGSLAAVSVLTLAPSAAFAASTDDYTVVSPPTAPTVKHPAVLPNTGADPLITTIGAAGAVLLVGGSGVVIVSRRRRTERAAKGI